jgi:hypothetical protein
MAMEYWILGRYEEGAAAAWTGVATGTGATALRAATFDTLALCLIGLGDAPAAAAAMIEAADLIVRFDIRGGAEPAPTTVGRIAWLAGDEAHAGAFVAAARRLASELRTVVESSLWEEPVYSVVIEKHPDAVRSLAGLDWRETLSAALEWGRSQTASGG